MKLSHWAVFALGLNVGFTIAGFLWLARAIFFGVH